MEEIEYSEAAVEVLDILNHTQIEDVKKIPQSFIEYLMDIANRNYKVNFDHSKTISELNLKQKTKELLGFIYITWWANSEEQEKIKKQIHNKKIKEEQIIDNSNLNDVFKNKKEEKIAKTEETTPNSMIVYKEENIFKKIINKILIFLGIKKRKD